MYFRSFLSLKEAIVDNHVETIKVCIPALIYTLQNNLYYISLTHLEATTFCVSLAMLFYAYSAELSRVVYYTS